MTTIYLDPVGMDATAGAIGGHAQQVQTLTNNLESACAAAVPAALAGWLAEELHGIAVQAQLAALLYTVAALDTALRAQQIQGDQSLVAAQPELATTSVDLGAALAMGSVVGGNGAAFDIVDPSGSSVDLGAILAEAGSTIGSPTAYLDLSAPGEHAELGAALAAAGGNIGRPTAADMPLITRIFTSQVSDHSNSVWNAPDGLSFLSPNRFEDPYGHQGDLSQTYRDPRTGDLRL